MRIFVILLVFCSFSEEDFGPFEDSVSETKLVEFSEFWIPYQVLVGYDYQDREMNRNGDEIAVGGLNLMLGREFSFSDEYLHTSWLSYSERSGEGKTYMGESAIQEIKVKEVMYIGTLNFEDYYEDLGIQPFIGVGVGMNYWENNVSLASGSTGSLSGSSFVLGLDLGVWLRYPSGILTMIRLGYRRSTIDEYERIQFVGNNSRIISSEFNSVNLIASIGYDL